MTNDCGTIQLSDREGNVKTYPVYGCGHCSDTVVMNARRVRERKTCTSCQRWICDTKELCQVACTPIYKLAEDHLEANPKYSTYLQALMAGHTTVASAKRAGLL